MTCELLNRSRKKMTWNESTTEAWLFAALLLNESMQMPSNTIKAISFQVFVPFCDVCFQFLLHCNLMDIKRLTIFCVCTAMHQLMTYSSVSKTIEIKKENGSFDLSQPFSILCLILFLLRIDLGCGTKTRQLLVYFWRFACVI